MKAIPESTELDINLMIKETYNSQAGSARNAELITVTPEFLCKIYATRCDKECQRPPTDHIALVVVRRKSESEAGMQYCDSCQLTLTSVGSYANFHLTTEESAILNGLHSCFSLLCPASTKKQQLHNLKREVKELNLYLPSNN